MKKFILLYSGPVDIDNPPVTQASIDQWAQKTGAAIVDRGTLFGPQAKAVLGPGDSTNTILPLRGYTIIQTNSMPEAVSLVGDHPFLTTNKENEIKVYELLSGNITPDMLTQVSYVAYTEGQPNISQTQANTVAPTAATVTPPTPTEPTASTSQPDVAQAPQSDSTTPQQSPGELNIPHEEPENPDQTQPPATPPPGSSIRPSA